VPGHEGIVGNETADQLASEHQLIGSEPACCISIGVAKKAAMDWTNRNHKILWESMTGLTQANELILGPTAGRTKDLLKLNRDQLRWVVGLLTGHCYLKGHLFKLGLTDDPICERCLEDESATYILCDCEAVAHVRFRHLGQSQSQSHITTDSQSVCLGVVPHLGHMTRNLFFCFNLRKLQSCLCGRPL
jgi:hypothetical protein